MRVSRLQPAASGRPALEEGEAVTHEQPAGIHVDGQLHDGGRLFVTGTRILWLPADRAGEGWGVRFSHISLHAVCRDQEAVPRPCVYCQLDREDEVSEVMVIPEDEEQLGALFKIFCEGVAANPPEGGDADEDDEGDEGELFYNEEEVELGARQAEMLDRFDAMLSVPAAFEEGQFDDAEQDDEAADASGRGDVDGAAAGGSGALNEAAKLAS